MKVPNFIEELHDNGVFDYDDADLELLNRHARVFYGLLGYEVTEGYDFTNSSHITEQTCFQMAVYAKTMADEGGFSTLN